MSKPARKPSAWEVLHDEFAEKETARDAAWRDYLQLSQAVSAKQAAHMRGHGQSQPSADEIDRVRDAKQRWEQIARELAALSERMTRA